jgi:hypothetical protein
MTPSLAIESVAKPRTGRSVTARADHSESVSIAATEHDRDYVVDLEVYGRMGSPAEAWADVAVRRDVRLKEGLALSGLGTVRCEYRCAYELVSIACVAGS